MLLSHPTGELSGTFVLPASKSESNRALIIQALASGQITLQNLSDAADTQTLSALLQNRKDGEWNVGHAGTAMRFLTAFLAFQPMDVVLTGSERMQERPIGPLVEALRQMGAEIDYLGKEGCPPLYIFGRNAHFGASEIAIRGDISSQFISALLLIAPTLPEGLTLLIEGELISRPYVDMTLALMGQFGARYSWAGNQLLVEPTGYGAGAFTVESDWSAAGYAYACVALARRGELFLPGLRRDSLQGDRKLVEWMEGLGVGTTFLEDGILIFRNGATLPNDLELDFREMPDQAQTVLPLLAALGVKGRFTGLESLRIKETDRIAALQAELRKCGCALSEPQRGVWELSGQFAPPTEAFETYEDHRMAMGLAPLAMLGESIQIEDAGVVVKSFPQFWKQMTQIGFTVE